MKKNTKSKNVTTLVSVITIGISFAVIAFQATSIVSLKNVSQIKTVQNSTDIGISLGLDQDGYGAGCDTDGTAFSISSRSSFMEVYPRMKDGKVMKCMTSDEAKSLMVSIGADNLTVENILTNYPDINKSIN